MSAKLELYNYFRSSASYRVRIALALKCLPFDYRPIHLLKDGGQQYSAEFTLLNPMHEVPCLVDGDFAVGQSMAILHYLDDLAPIPTLFPKDPQTRARVIQLCEVVNSGIHPLQNLKVLQELERRFGASTETREDWARHWIEQGFTALEKILEHSAGEYSVGDSLTAADLYLIPQVFNARRFKVDLTHFQFICAIEARCLALEAFKLSEPKAQPDFV